MDQVGTKAAAVAPTAAVKKDRRIVSWTPQEDELLREQISTHGTDNWTSIAAQFKDKTARQCRRRWYTYLNAECKKGGWSAEEDMILCEAQKIFGNRWTEIAKVVSGRTDNAVKNRFSTLCKKRAKIEALSKENTGSCINMKNRKIMIQNKCITAGISESSASLKQIRYQTSGIIEDHSINENLPGKYRMEEQSSRPPLAMLAKNFDNAANLATQHHTNNKPEAATYDVSSKCQGTFLKRDDPKLTALLQQADLLSSLALKVNAENTNQSFEDAWKEIQDYLIQTEESGMLSKISEMDLLNDFRDLIEDLRSGSAGEQPSWRRSEDIYEDNQGSPEYSTGSTNCSKALENKNQDHQPNECSSKPNAEVSAYHEESVYACTYSGQEVVISSNQGKDGNADIFAFPNSEVGSPLQTIPLFHTFAEGIPSPKFSASERKFLLSVLGVSSPEASPNPVPPPCKRSLINSL